MSSLASTATVGTNMFVNNPGSTIKGQGLKGVSAQNGLEAVKGDAGTLLSDGDIWNKFRFNINHIIHNFKNSYK